MKHGKKLALALALILILTLAACAPGATTPAPATATPAAPAQPATKAAQQVAVNVLSQGLPQRADLRLLPNSRPDEVNGVLFTTYTGNVARQEAWLKYDDGTEVYVVANWCEDGAECSEDRSNTGSTVTMLVTYSDEISETQTFEQGDHLFEVSYEDLTVWVKIGAIKDAISLDALAGDIKR